jgi:excisionase family DNA binding protein
MDNNLIVITRSELKSLLKEVVSEALANQEPPKKRYYTRKEVCDILHITLPTLWNMVKSGKLAQKKVGTRCLYDADSIDELVNNNKKR